jgi:predicted AAA+ superfamily ATPase
MTPYHHRLLETKIQAALLRGKSILLLGARQTGKTTLIKQATKPDLSYNLSIPKLRQQFERDPDSLSAEIEAFWATKQPDHLPLVVIDEVQKVPELMDVAQYLIDDQRAQLILTGSSARKLKHNQQRSINLLPGRVVMLHLDALCLPEIPAARYDLTSLLLYGSLPGIIFDATHADREQDLSSYVETYLEEEIRQEGLIRNLGAFSRFLELAALSMGEPINFSRLSQDIGVSVHTVTEYFQILEDCLIIEKINPITANTRRKLTKAPKFLFFDLGVKRLCAKEGQKLSQRAQAALFEQFVGMELLRYIHLDTSGFRLQYWRDHNGPEIDYVIDMHQQYLPVEVKWTENPSAYDCRHLEQFMSEHPSTEYGYLVCRVPKERKITKRVIALPWQALPTILPAATSETNLD